MDVFDARNSAGAGENEALAGLAAGPRRTTRPAPSRIFARLTQRPAKLNVLADLCAGMARARSAEGARPGHARCAGRRGPDGRGGGQEQGVGRPGRGEEAPGRGVRPARAADGRMVVPSVSMARLLPLAVRVDPDRSSEYLWRAIAARPPRAGAVHGSRRSRPGSTTWSSPGSRRWSPATTARRPRRSSPRSPTTPGPDRRPIPTSSTRPARSSRPPRPSIRARPWP